MMTRVPPQDSMPTRRPLVLIYLIAAVASLTLALSSLLGITASSLLLATALPWAGTLLYPALAAATVWRPNSSLRLFGISSYTFTHSYLLLDAALTKRYCAPCVAVGCLALVAAFLECRAFRSERITVASGLVFGIVTAILVPFETIDFGITRKIWPPRVISILPGFVSRTRFADCGHQTPLRILIYDKSCSTCGGIQKSILPHLKREYPTDVCAHLSDLPNPPAGQRLPVFVLVRRSDEFLVIEGRLDYPDLRVHIKNMLMQDQNHR
jgi:hypothetical protein